MEDAGSAQRPSRRPRQIAILGFDGMDAELVQRWSAAGHLPTFARLLGSAAWSQFELPAEFSSGMVWPSINTGLAPAAHQGYFGTRLVEGTYSLRPRRTSDIRGAPFWRELAAHGRRLVIMDVPFSPVDSCFGGRQITGWGQHEWSGRRESIPSQLLDDVERDFGRYPITPSVEDVWEHGGPRELINGLLQGIERRTRILHHLADARDWDFLYAVYPESHGAGHHLWHLSDTSHPGFDPQEYACRGDAMLGIYSALDRSLQSLTGALRDDAALVIILSHGMGPNYNGNHLFPDLLERFNRAWAGDSGDARAGNALAGVWESTIGRVPARIRCEARRLLPMYYRQWLSAKRRQNPGIWRNAPAFALPGLDGFAAVRVNLLGREPDGVIEAGKEYDRYMEALLAEIDTWTVRDTGSKAVARVHRSATGNDALKLGVAPDLMMWWSKAGAIEQICSPALGNVHGVSGETRTGEHIMRSLLLLSHASMQPGSRTIPGLGLTDIAPTLLELAGVPTDVQGNGRSRLREFQSPDQC